MNLVVYSSEGRNSNKLIDENLNLCVGAKCHFDAYDFDEVLEVIEECQEDEEAVTFLFCKYLNLDLSKLPKYSKLKWYEV